MNRPPGIGDFVASFKGDSPGHPFRGNQYEGGSGDDEPDYTKMSSEELTSHINSLAADVDRKKNAFFDADRAATRAAAVRVTPQARELGKIADQKRAEWDEAHKKYEKAFNASEEGKKKLEAMGEYMRTHKIPAVQQGRFSTSR